MSIYRGFGKPASGGAPAATGRNDPADPQDWSAWRKAEPATVLLKNTAHWIGSLPAEMQPRTLAAQFPRVANALCANWDDPVSFSGCIDELLTDRRGGRRGFPAPVVSELQALRTYRHWLHAWNPAGKR